MDVSDFLPNGFNLRQGAGGGDPANGLCYMETVSLIAGEKISDQPECACPIITRYGICLNDRFAHDERQRLLPLAWATAGTKSKAHERQRLEIFGRAACDMALMVLPIYQAKHPSDQRAKHAIEAALVYWKNPSEENRAAAAYAAYADADADAAAAAAYAAYAAAYAADADAADAAAYAAADAAAAADAGDKQLRTRIIDRSVTALREAIEAGPNGGFPEKEVIQSIDAVKDRLLVAA